MLRIYTLAFNFVLTGCYLVQPDSNQKKEEKRLQVVDRKETSLKLSSQYAAELNKQINAEKSPEKRALLQAAATTIEEKISEKRMTNALAAANTKIIADAMQDHTEIYPLRGPYKILVIPVAFTDTGFADPDFYAPYAGGQSKAQNYLFGDEEGTLTTYYKHSSLGQFDLSGVVTPIVTVDNPLAYYGEAVTGKSDKNARRLVVDALVKLKNRHSNDWWQQFDSWDLNDYDADGHFHEPDGFIDAVVLVYAGKSQSSCQRSFDPEGTRPASADVPEGPRKEATIECFNRIWPHRWAISLAADDPLYSENGPKIEGRVRPSMNGLKITDEIFATDYNMQSEYSDRSTFMHEFGHSLTLPDVYAYSGENNTGSWEIMSSNANLQGQEFSSYSKLSLGWIKPKIIFPGSETSAYLGAWSYVANERRDNLASFDGPRTSEEYINGQIHSYDVTSFTQEFEEPVYRSIVALQPPTIERIKVAEFPENIGEKAAYTGRFDGDSRSIEITVDVPTKGPAILTFDTFFHIETETNFNGTDADIKVVTDYDIGSVLVNNENIRDLRTISGDNNADTLNESNPLCAVNRVLQLRLKNIDGALTEDEKKEFEEKKLICQKPTWTVQNIDLSQYRGQKVKVEVRYVTDSGYTELGIIADNFKIDDSVVEDFETKSENFGDWKILADNGHESKSHNQFYLFEYRTPGETYEAAGNKSSLNMDNNLLNTATQSYFKDGFDNPIDAYRMVEMPYQPGVLVWYYNSKFSTRDNGASEQEGKGYLLVVNPKVDELPLPGIFSNPDLKDEKGHYDPESPGPLKTLIDSQKNEFICFSHTVYDTYIKGEAPECNLDVYTDALQTITFKGKPAMYRRQWFNDLLPVDRYQYKPVGTAFRNLPGIRTGLSTFRPQTAEPFSVFSIYRINQNRELVLDLAETVNGFKNMPVSKFSDADNQLSENPRFWADQVVVEKNGFEFEVVEPSSRITSGYSRHTSGADNNAYARRPRAKIYFQWTD